MFDLTKEEYETLKDKLMLNDELSKIFEMKIKNYSITKMALELNMSESTVSNKRNNRKITYNGETKTLSQWSREYNINIVTLSDRLKVGLSIDEALNKPVIKSGGKLLYTLNGETKLLSEWCKIYNINYQTAWKKIKNGKSIEKALKLE